MRIQDAIADLRSAIDYGESVGALAPSGHPLHAALDVARDRLEWLHEDYVYAMTGGELLRAVAGEVREAVAAVYRHAETVRVDPDKPLPATSWRTWAPDWRWAVGGAAGLVALWLLFREDQ